MHKVLAELLEIEQNGDREQISFYIKWNLERLQATYPYLHDSLGVGRAIERILKEEKDKEMILSAIEKMAGSDEWKYKKRNYALILANIYLEEDDISGIESVTEKYLADEFKFHGYRKMMAYYAGHYDEKKFLELFKKIEKRNRLMPEDHHAIHAFIEKYASNSQDIQVVKDLVKKKKIYPQLSNFIVPMVVGYVGGKQDLDAVERIVFEEIDEEYERYYYAEEIYNELYKRSDNKAEKLALLAKIEDLAERTPKELKVKGYPGKLRALIQWRVGCKYLEMGEKEKVEAIIKSLRGKNKESLKSLYAEKYG